MPNNSLNFREGLTPEVISVDRNAELDTAVGRYEPRDQYLLKVLADPTIISLDSSAPDILDRILQSGSTLLPITEASSLESRVIPNLSEQIELNRSSAEALQLLANIYSIEPTQLKDILERVSPDEIHKTDGSQKNPLELLHSVVDLVAKGDKTTVEIISNNAASLDLPSNFDGYVNKLRRPENNFNTLTGTTNIEGQSSLTLPYSRSEQLKNRLLKQLIAKPENFTDNITFLIDGFSQDAIEKSQLSTLQEQLSEEKSRERITLSIPFMELFVRRFKSDPSRNIQDYALTLREEVGDSGYLDALRSAYTSLAHENSTVGQISEHGLAYPLPSYDTIINTIIPNLERHLASNQDALQTAGVTITMPQLIEMYTASYFPAMQ